MPGIDEAVAKRGVRYNVPILGQKDKTPTLVALCTVVPGGAAQGITAMFFSAWTESIRNPRVSPLYEVSGVNIERARNTLCERVKNSVATHLLFIDADEVWDPDDMWAFIDRAAEKQYDVVSAVVNRMEQKSVSEFHIHPSVYDENLRPLQRPEEGGYQEVSSVGAGALLLSKRLIVAMGKDWFTRDVMAENGNVLGEDLCFSKHVRDHGIKMYVDWDWQLGHIKQIPI